MPKGVEHLELAERAAEHFRVPLAVMPKGVEHAEASSRYQDALGQVPLAVMPKGVEHCQACGDTHEILKYPSP